MSNSPKINITGGLSLPSVVFCIFLILKLTGYIGWSWWWVTAPLWGPAVVVIAIVIVVILIMAICSLFSG